MRIEIKDYLARHPNYLVIALLLADEGNRKPLLEFFDSEASSFKALKTAKLYAEHMKIYSPHDFPISLSPNGEITKLPERLAGFIFAEKNWFWSIFSRPGVHRVVKRFRTLSNCRRSIRVNCRLSVSRWNPVRKKKSPNGSKIIKWIIRSVLSSATFRIFTRICYQKKIAAVFPIRLSSIRMVTSPSDSLATAIWSSGICRLKSWCRKENRLVLTRGFGNESPFFFCWIVGVRWKEHGTEEVHK